MTRVSKPLQEFLLTAFLSCIRHFVGTAAGRGHLEVERKFRLSADEQSLIPQKLYQLGFSRGAEVHMTDSFLPTVQAGEMFRVRVEKHATHTSRIITLKSWATTADGGKERKETERNIGTCICFLLITMGRWLNGGKLLSFDKFRRHYNSRLEGADVVVSIDKVDGLGSYAGFYLEVEILVKAECDVSKARKQILTLASKLLGEGPRQETRSYLEMLKLSLNERAR